MAKLKQRFKQLTAYAPVVKKVVGLNPASDRYWELDLVRGICIIFMVAFHLSWDLQYFNVIEPDSLFASIMRYIANLRGIFIVIVGISLSLSYRRAKAKQTPESEIFKSLLLRGLVIFAFGMVITGVTFILGTGTIDFGILHLIGFSVIASWPFLRYRWLSSNWPLYKYRTVNLIVGVVVILVGYFYVLEQTFSFPWLLWLGFQPALYNPADYFPVFPWFGWALVGIFLGYLMYQPPYGRRYPIPRISGWVPVKLGTYIGRNSLFIYLIHQPIIFPIAWAIGTF